jgi:hypothetical protein
MRAAGVALVPMLFMLFGAVAVGVLLYVASEQAKKRRAAMLAWAGSRGWTLLGDASYLAGRWRGAPFGIGRGRRVTNAATGTFAGRPGITFDYQYTTGSGKNRTTHHYHVMVLSMPAPLPHLQLTPENFGTTIAKVFGGEDIEFESEQFNQMWRVQSSVPRFAFDVVHPRLMERLLYPDARGPMRFEGADLVSWRSGLQDPRWIDGRLALLNDVIDSIPDFVWRQVGHDPGRTAAGGPWTGTAGGGPR